VTETDQFAADAPAASPRPRCPTGSLAVLRYLLRATEPGPVVEIDLSDALIATGS
jgi:hypothetical protein